MIDLTPLDVRKKRGDFRRILRGYDPEEVDTFMDLVADRFEELVRENLHLSEKTESLETQLESLVSREKAVQDALVSAQKLREDLKAQSQKDAETRTGQAQREAELLKAEAEMEIQRRLGEAEGLIRERQRALEELERSRLKFLKSFRGLLEREIDSVEVEESRRPLEETPLDLNLRGWARSGEEEADTQEANSVPEENTSADVPAPVPVEATDPEEAGEVLGGFGTRVLEVAAPVDIGDLAPAEEEPDLAAAEEEPYTAEEPKWLFSLLKKEGEEGAEE
ncbi:MAG: DivIVA domain-containing protein [Gemmatimonadota bacterium]|jgi:DivIVA domain-containing protein